MPDHSEIPDNYPQVPEIDTSQPARSPVEWFPYRLRELRKLRNLTQQQLADRVNEIGGDGYVHGVKWTKSTVAKLEPGSKTETRRVTVDELLALAIALECSVESLLLPRDPNTGVRVGDVDIPAGFVRPWIGGDYGVPGALQQIGEFADGLRPPVVLAPVYEEAAGRNDEARKVYERWARYHESLGDEWSIAFERFSALRDVYECTRVLIDEVGATEPEGMNDVAQIEWWLEEWAEDLERAAQQVRRQIQKRLRALTAADRRWSLERLTPRTTGGDQ